MAAVVTFELTPNPRIVEVDSGQDVNTLSLVEIYSEWKEWERTSGYAGQSPIAFLQTGMRPLDVAETEFSPVFFFLHPTWKIRPAEADHKLIIDGNLWTQDGSSAFVETVGGYTVNTETRVSLLSAVASGVWNALRENHQASGSMGELLLRTFIAALNANAGL